MEDLNLTSHRAPASVWDNQKRLDGFDLQTIGRALAVVGGGILIMKGLRDGSRTGRALAGLGGALGALGISGPEGALAARRWCANALSGIAREFDDLVEESSDESFPASDPPSWSPTVAGVRHGH